MTTKTAAVNYTAEQVARMVADYQAAPTAETVAALAEAFGKTVKSVVAKLSREGVYVAKTATGTGRKVALKADLVAELSKRANNFEFALKGATRQELEILLQLIPVPEAE